MCLIGPSCARLALLLACSPLGILHAVTNYARPYTFTTLAGTSGATSIAADGAGTLYIPDAMSGAVQKLTGMGVSTLLGTIPAAREHVYLGPNSVAVDTAGNVFIADGQNNRIVKISPSGTASNFAGNSTPNPNLPPLFPLGPSFGSIPDPSNAGYSDGPASAARFSFPVSVAVDHLGNVYVGESGNRVVRKISPGGSVTTLAGAPGRPINPEADGTGSGAWFGGLQGMAIDSSGNLYVADNGLNAIRKITPQGVVTTLAGGSKGSTDGTGPLAQFNAPSGLAVDSASNIFVVDAGNHVIREIDPNSVVTTLAGVPGIAGNVDGAGATARFTYPYGIAVDQRGVVYVTDGSIRKGIATPSTTPFITVQPYSHTTTAGSTVVFSVAAGGGDLRYQWRKNGADISGATSPQLALMAVTGVDAASYSVALNNNAGTILSAPASLTISAAAHGQLINLSIRSRTGTGDSTLIAGFVIGGAGAKPTVIRGLGPALAPYGVNNAAADPELELFNATGVEIARNDNWNAGPLTATFTALGAGALAENSLDAAMLSTLVAGPYSVHVTSSTGSGVVLFEAYDASASNGARFVNLSARAEVGVRDDLLIAGFVISGAGSRTVLLRGVGPTLSRSGVQGALADPQIQLFDGAGHLIIENDDWGGGSALSQLFETIGAFSFPATSKDAAILITLPPGAYSAEIRGVGETTGIALAEIYEVN